mgnify:CR=1 FL=1
MTAVVGTAALLGSFVLVWIWLRRGFVLDRAQARLGPDPDDSRLDDSRPASGVGSAGRADEAAGASPASPARAIFAASWFRVARWVVPVFLLGLGLWWWTLGIPLPIALALSLDGAILSGLARGTIQDRRDLRIEEQLAESLRLTSAGLRAGLGRVDALHRAAGQIDAPLRPILLDTVGQLRLGEDPEQAFQRLAQRVPLETFRLFAMVIATQWGAGGSLQNTFASVGSFMQDRVEVGRRIAAQAAPTRSAILTLVAATAAIAWFSWSNDPTNLERFLRSEWGSGLVATALTLQGLSLLWMWRLSRVRI